MLCKLSLVLVLVILITSCGGTSRIKWSLSSRNLPEQYKLNHVPFYPQQKYQCGPAALSMALAWAGVQVSPENLVSEVFTPSRKGSLQSAIIASIRRHKRVAYPIASPGSLIDEIAAGHPVIVLQNLGLSWYPVWHYAVVIGFDLNKDNVILHSGVVSQKHLNFKVFERTWARSNFWGILVLPPTQLPADAIESKYISAVNGLERLGLWKAAAEGYKTALNHWPDSFLAHMGLGVCYYELGNLKSAESVILDAIRKFPTEGAAFNNLAQVLMEQGRKCEALAAALRAVELGGPLEEHFKSTLEEIRNK